MNTFTPTGLTLPDCHCFREKAKAMNDAIDGITALNIIQIRGEIAALNLCTTAYDHYIAALIWSTIAATIAKEDRQDQSFESYAAKYEAAYDRLKPLVMQRLAYADGVLMSSPFGR